MRNLLAIAAPVVVGRLSPRPRATDPPNAAPTHTSAVPPMLNKRVGNSWTRRTVLNLVGKQMKRSSWLLVASFVALGIVLIGLTGCRRPGGCQNGGCSAPTGGYSSPGYGGSSFQGSATVSPEDSAPSQSYTAPKGSGTRSAPVMRGSGTR